MRSTCQLWWTKHLRTGFRQKHTVTEAIEEVISAYRNGQLKDEDLWYNIRTMKNIENLG